MNKRFQEIVWEKKVTLKNSVSVLKKYLSVHPCNLMKIQLRFENFESFLEVWQICAFERKWVYESRNFRELSENNQQENACQLTDLLQRDEGSFVVVIFPWITFKWFEYETYGKNVERLTIIWKLDL